MEKTGPSCIGSSQHHSALWIWWRCGESEDPLIDGSLDRFHKSPTEKKILLAILCALFGMVKWPFQRLNDLQLRDQKVTLNHLAVVFDVPLFVFLFCFGWDPNYPKSEGKIGWWRRQGVGFWVTASLEDLAVQFNRDIHYIRWSNSQCHLFFC